MRVLLRPRWLAWHAGIVIVTAGMLYLGDWQLHRALSGNELSWAYTFEWPLFAIFAVFFWVKSLRDELREAGPSATGHEAGNGAVTSAEPARPTPMRRAFGPRFKVTAAGTGCAKPSRIGFYDWRPDVAWDFSTEPEFQEQLDWVADFCKNEIEPLDLVFPGAAYSRNPKAKALADPLKQQVKDRGLWALFLDKDLGGPGFGQLKLALLNEILGRYRSAPVVFGTAAPDTGNMEMLAAYGTQEQKDKWLYPLMNQEIFSAYSMTEPQGGSDPNLFRTLAERDGDEWVITGEKWFTSAGARADIIFVMCTNGMFVVPRETPGVQIMDYPPLHNHVRYDHVRVPAGNLLGPEDGAKVLAQRRLGGGRIHHAMRTVAQVRLAFDMMCERALSRAVARQGDRGPPDGARGDRRLVRRDQYAAPAGAVDGVDHR